MGSGDFFVAEGFVCAAFLCKVFCGVLETRDLGEEGLWMVV